MTESIFRTDIVTAEPEKLLGGLDADQIVRLRDMAGELEDITYNGLFPGEIIFTANRVLMRQGNEAASTTLANIYRDSNNALTEGFEPCAFDEQLPVDDPERYATSLNQALDALSLGLNMYLDDYRTALSRISSAAGYLFNQGAIDGGIVIRSRGRDYHKPQDEKADMLIKTAKFAGDLLNAATVMDQAGLPGADLDVLKAWRNYNRWKTEQVKNDPEEAISVYGDVYEVQTNLIKHGYDTETTKWLAVPTLETIAGLYNRRRPQHLRIVSMLALADLVDRSPYNKAYNKLVNKVSRNSGTMRLLSDEIFVNTPPRTHEGDEREKELAEYLTGKPVVNTGFLLRMMTQGQKS